MTEKKKEQVGLARRLAGSMKSIESVLPKEMDSGRFSLATLTLLDSPVSGSTS